MVKEFNGYWALILGGSSGLGYASALKLARHGMNLCIVHRNTRSEMEKIQAGFEQLRALGIELLTFNVDVLDATARTYIILELKKKILGSRGLRCLLHSIAKGNLKPMWNGVSARPAKGADSAQQPDTDNIGELTLEDFQLTMNNMAFSLYSWVKAVHRSGLLADHARVIAFTSEGSHKTIKHYAAVSAAKAALEAIVRSIAYEFTKEGLTANCIQAGVTDTDALRKIPGSEELLRHTINRNPSARLTTPQDVAGLVYLLCREEAGWINGTIIPADGGEQLN